MIDPIDQLGIPPDLLMLGGMAVLVLIAASSLVVSFVLARRIRLCRQEVAQGFANLDAQSRHKLVQAAAAAAVIAGRHHDSSLDEIRDDIGTVLKDWDTVESLAERAESRLSQLSRDEPNKE